MLSDKNFEKLFKHIEYGNDNVFITGQAGTGKSTFLNYFRKFTTKKVAVVAPTGVAALNVRGQTIHSFFKFKPRFLDKSTIKKVREAKSKKIYKSLDMLIIDEISMVRADIFDAIEKFLSINGPMPGTLFGGVQICVIGDLFQLPPVVGYAEKEMFYNFYKSSYFFSSDAFKVGNFKLIELSKIYRQTDDRFIEVLNKIREGNATDELLLKLNKRVVIGGNANTDKDNLVVLTTTNAIAINTNNKKLNELTTSEKTYEALVEGKFEEKEDKLPVSKNLTLKIGAQVMFIRNDMKRRWVNGTIGKITALAKDYVEVQVKKEDKTRHYQIEKEEWENVRYNFDEKEQTFKEEIIGKFTQFPLICAWAITIHKSQGKTLDNITIDLGSGAFAPGQLYVALSRCPKLDSINLLKPVSVRDIYTDHFVKKFFQWYVPRYKIEIFDKEEEVEEVYF